MAAAGFQLPPDPEEQLRREQALKLGVQVATCELTMVDTDPAAIVKAAEAFLNFLNGKPATPQE